MTSLAFDALVIGSGMGGLSAAALLASEGFKTLVAEALPRIGGRCSTVEYKGFKCTTGVIGPETGGVVESVFRKVGARFDIRSAGPPHYLVDGRIHRIAGGGGLKKLLSAASANDPETERVRVAFSRAMSQAEPGGTLSLDRWLRELTDNRNILDIFQTMVAATLMVNSDEVAAAEFFRFLKTLGGVTNFGFCPEGSIALPQALAETIRKSGGEVWTACRAKGITVENGVARGAVLTKDGRDIEVDAAAVLSNAGPRRTVELAGKENFSRSYLFQLDRDAVPAPVFALQIASDEPLIEGNYLLVTGARRLNAVYQPTLVCPELAPAGRHLLLAGAGPASSMPPLDTKKELDLCLQDLRDLIPAFDKGAHILLSGCYHGAWPGMHCWPGRDLPPKTPIRNLYNVGDGAKPPGTTGLPSAVASAMRVVEDVKRET